MWWHSFAQNAVRRQSASPLASWRTEKAFASCSPAETGWARSSPPRHWPAISEKTYTASILGAVVSKYIGETEKNLRGVFHAARKSRAVLFLDEADALFRKRSEVKDSHDRFANIEINYLLKRIEEYVGLAILASGNRTKIDSAFSRRFHFVISIRPRRKARSPGK